MQWTAILLVATLELLGASLFCPGVAVGGPLMVPTPTNDARYPQQKALTLSRPQGNAVRPSGLRALSFAAGAVGMTLALGTLIKQLRQEKGLSQRQLAQACQVSPGYLSLIESGQRMPPEALCVQLAAVLDYDARELAGRSQLVKSPQTAKTLYGSPGGGNDPADSGGHGDDYDPELDRLCRQVRNLRTLMSEEGYGRLIESMIMFLRTHEAERSPRTSGGVEKEAKKPRVRLVTTRRETDS